MIFVPPGTTQIQLLVGLFDSAGAAITGKVATTFSLPVLSLIAGQQPGTLTLSNLANATASFSAGGLFELGAGRYRLDCTANGVAQVLNIVAEGTVGSVLVESVLFTSSTSLYLGANILAVNGSSGAASNLSGFPLVTTTSPMFGVTVVVDNGTTTRNANLLTINGSAPAASALSFFGTQSIDTTTRLIKSDLRAINASSSAALALSFASNDTNNLLLVSAQISGTVDANIVAINGDTGAASDLEQIARLIPGQVTIQSPVLSSSLIKIMPGDDYFAADARALDFTFTNVPSLTGGTVTLKANNFLLTGSIQSAGTIRFEPTATQTTKLAVGTLPFTLHAVLSSGHEITLCTGTIDSRP